MKSDPSVFRAYVKALQSALTYAGYQMLLAGHEHSPAAEFELVQALLARGVDALVLVGGEHPPELWGVLTAWNKPALLTWSGDSRLPSVGIDNEVAAQVAAEHLLELGHQRIGVIAGITADSERARSRVQGVRKALEQAGLTLPTSLFTVQEFSFEGGRSGLRILTAARAPPSAIFCGNDLLRAGALLEAPRLGLKVPQQLAICGFDDMEFASALNPGLTTIRVPVRDMGRVVAHSVLSLLAGEPVARQTLLPFDLMVRGSTVASGSR